MAAEERDIVSPTAGDKVTPRAAGNGVIAVAAIDREIDLTGMKMRGVDGVVAAESIHGERVEAGIHAAHGRPCRR